MTKIALFGTFDLNFLKILNNLTAWSILTKDDRLYRPYSNLYC